MVDDDNKGAIPLYVEGASPKQRLLPIKSERLIARHDVSENGLKTSASFFMFLFNLLPSACIVNILVFIQARRVIERGLRKWIIRRHWVSFFTLLYSDTRTVTPPYVWHLVHERFTDAYNKSSMERSASAAITSANASSRNKSSSEDLRCYLYPDECPEVGSRQEKMFVLSKALYGDLHTARALACDQIARAQSRRAERNNRRAARPPRSRMLNRTATLRSFAGR